MANLPFMLSDRLCECGCGQRTAVYRTSWAERGWVRGEPRRFVRGHWGRTQKKERPKKLERPPRACGCGCSWPAPKGRKYVDGHAPSRRAALESWYRVDESGCWLWTGTVDARGYGRLNVDRSKPKAHRVLYERYVGEIPAGWHVHHRCGVRTCVNPAHLEAVSPDRHTFLHLVERQGVERAREWLDGFAA